MDNVQLRVKEDPRIDGLARCIVVDEHGLQAWPKPGWHETVIACQRYIEWYGNREVATVRDP